jgi:predicted Holliday junction resolvase-like endonuclease
MVRKKVQDVVNIVNEELSDAKVPIQVESVDEFKRKLLRWVIHFWYLVVIVVLAVVLMLYRQSLLKTKMELENAQVGANLAKEMALTEAKLKEMKDREAELYPELERKTGELNAIQGQIEKERAKLVVVKRQVIAAQVQTMDIDTLSKELNRMGYGNTVVK